VFVLARFLFNKIKRSIVCRSLTIVYDDCTVHVNTNLKIRASLNTKRSQIVI